MEVTILNHYFREEYVLDAFKSLVWTEKFWECGEFEIITSPTPEILLAINSNYYDGLIRIAGSERLMFIEDLTIKTEGDDGDELIITGRGLESVLDRRIVWDPTTLSGNFQNSLESLLKDNLASGHDMERDIPDWAFKPNDDAAITSLTIDAQYWGENIYSIVSSLCKSKGIGFMMTRNYATSQTVFMFYAGVDRTYAQTANPYVAFTSDLENLVSSEYMKTNRTQRTVCLAAGSPGVGNIRTTKKVYSPDYGVEFGYNRYEMFLEANVSRNSPDGGELTEEEYLAQLEGKALEELGKRKKLSAFDSEVDTEMYKYGEDFYLGDILQVRDKYGNEATARVTEVTFSENEEAIKVYPTFEYVATS